MSRIGRQPIKIPDKVQVNFSSNTVTINGPKGELSQWIDPKIEIEIKENQVFLKRFSDNRHHRTLHGLYRALINNMVIGVSQGFKKSLDIIGIGYRAKMEGTTLILNLGHSHPIKYNPPPGITITCEKQNYIEVAGTEKQLVGQVAAIIREFRLPEPYKGKGVRYRDEVIKLKAGKAGA
jgi:large subunit ribosomal protein L6